MEIRELKEWFVYYRCSDDDDNNNNNNNSDGFVFCSGMIGCPLPSDPPLALNVPTQFSKHSFAQFIIFNRDDMQQRCPRTYINNTLNLYCLYSPYTCIISPTQLISTATNWS